MKKTEELYRRAKRFMPGGTQLLTKRPELLLPGLWPTYYQKARGCDVWDLEGRRFIDASYMGIGSCILGYADKDVDNAVRRAIDKGSMSTLNCAEEIELAELLCKIHPWAKMARFARTGGEAMAISVRIARAHTGREVVLFCGYHGWHDWYLSANLADSRALDGHLLPGLNPAGIPRCLKGTALPFTYNDIRTFLKLVRRNRRKIAAVVMEPIRNYYPEKGFLDVIREVTEKEKIVLIFDEITAGWRLCAGGAHLKFRVYPDICVFAKAMSNGYPMAAVIGRKRVMETAQKTFISSTYWTERIGPVAALETIKKIRRKDVPGHLESIGKTVQEGWRNLARKHALDIGITGIYPLGIFKFNHKNSLLLKTLFTQFVLERGFLATTAFYASYAHKEKMVQDYLRAADEAFGLIRQAVKSGNPKRFLKGPICQSGFKRLT